MINLFRPFFILVLSVILSSCASQIAIQSDFDSQYDLSSYKTFSIQSPSLEGQESELSLNPILIQRIERSLNSALQNKGLTNSGEGDLVVRFFLGTQREIERSTDLGGYGYYGYRYFDARDQRYIRSDKDEIVLRFHDKRTDDVIWYAFTRFKRPTQQYSQASVDTLVQELLISFN